MPYVRTPEGGWVEIGKPQQWSFSTAERDALDPTSIVPYRLIYHEDQDRFERWDPALATWEAVVAASRPGHTHDYSPSGHDHDAAYINTTGGVLTGDLTLHSYRERAQVQNTTSWGVSFVGPQYRRNNSTGAITVTWASIESSSSFARSLTLVLAGPPSSITWPSGTKFAGGAPPDIDGETWLTAVSTGGVVTVGLAWPGVA